MAVFKMIDEVIAARDRDHDCKQHDQSHGAYKDHNLISPTDSNACQNDDGCQPTLT